MSSWPQGLRGWHSNARAGRGTMWLRATLRVGLQMREINKLTDDFNWKTGLYHGVDYHTSRKIPKGSYRIKDGESWIQPDSTLE